VYGADGADVSGTHAHDQEH